LAAVIVQPAGACLSADQVTSDAQVGTLWEEARKGVETRRAFDLRWRYRRLLRQEVEVRWRFRRNARRVQIDTLLNEPDSVLVRDARREARHRERGFSSGDYLVIPNEKELFGATFLTDHCLEGALERRDSTLGLRFRPIRARQDAVQLSGTIWIDAETYQMTALDVAHIRNTRDIARSRIEYGNVPVMGQLLRLPLRGHAAVRPPGMNKVVVSRATAQLTYEYDDFQLVRPD
jgi:hypothetical protein